jgi:dephospho-CoA kinase
VTPRVRRIALTGGIATGKSHVRARLEQAGVATIDSDVLARQAVAPGTSGLAAVAARFGPQVITPDGTLDRARLGSIVFADTEARRDLEAIIHPDVRRATDEWFASLDSSRHPFAVADIPLLFEVGRDRDFDVVIVVACDPETQVQRVMQRDGLTETAARQRLAAQLPITEKIRRANFVITTDADYEETDRQVDEVLRALGPS